MLRFYAHSGQALLLKEVLPRTYKLFINLGVTGSAPWLTATQQALVGDVLIEFLAKTVAEFYKSPWTRSS